MIAYSEFSRDARIRREAEALTEIGYNVDFFTLKEKKMIRIQTNVNLIYLNLEQYRGNSNFKYIFSYLKFFFQSFIKILWLYPKKKYKLIYTHNMPDFLVFLGFIPKLFGCKLVHDIHDLMPDIYRTKFKGGLSIIIYYLLLFQEQISCFLANKVITVHEPLKKILVQEHKIKSEKIQIVRNIADDKLFTPINQYETKTQEFRILHHGTIAERFGLDYIVKEFNRVKHKYPNIKLDIYGKGDGNSEIKLKNLITKLKLNKNITLHGQVPLEDIPKIIASSNLGVISYKPDKSTDMFLPLKLLEYIAMEVPALTIRNTTINYYFKENHFFFYKHGVKNSFSNMIINILENPECLKEVKNKMKKIKTDFNWENEKRSLQKIVTEILK